MGVEPGRAVRRWPTGGGGFEHFYGFIGGETNQYYPSLFQGTTPVEPERTPEEGYHLTDDLTDNAVAWLRQQQALSPDRPFFLYFAPGAAHAPHHVPPGLGGALRRRVRRRLGRPARADPRPAEGARRGAARTPS